MLPKEAHSLAILGHKLDPQTPPSPPFRCSAARQNNEPRMVAMTICLCHGVYASSVSVAHGPLPLCPPSRLPTLHRHGRGSEYAAPDLADSSEAEEVEWWEELELKKVVVPPEKDLSPAAVPRGPADVAIVSWSTGQGPRQLMATRNHRRYARQHGYAYHNGSDLEAADVLHLVEPASWGKLYLMQAYLRRYAVVVWLDSDALVANSERRVEAWVEEMGSAPSPVARCAPVRRGLIGCASHSCPEGRDGAGEGGGFLGVDLCFGERRP